MHARAEGGHKWSSLISQPHTASTFRSSRLHQNIMAVPSQTGLARKAPGICPRALQAKGTRELTPEHYRLNKSNAAPQCTEVHCAAWHCSALLSIGCHSSLALGQDATGGIVSGNQHGRRRCGVAPASGNMLWKQGCRGREGWGGSKHELRIQASASLALTVVMTALGWRIARQPTCKGRGGGGWPLPRIPLALVGSSGARGSIMHVGYWEWIQRGWGWGECNRDGVEIVSQLAGHSLDQQGCREDESGMRRPAQAPAMGPHAPWRDHLCTD